MKNDTIFKLTNVQKLGKKKNLNKGKKLATFIKKKKEKEKKENLLQFYTTVKALEHFNYSVFFFYLVEFAALLEFVISNYSLIKRLVNFQFRLLY